jgi:hypothetical protein
MSGAERDRTADLYVANVPLSQTELLPHPAETDVQTDNDEPETCNLSLATFYGGEGGIRTRGSLHYTRFPSVLLQPLGHLSREYQISKVKNQI